MAINTNTGTTGTGYKTENVSNSVALIVYPWNEAYALQQRREGILQIDLSTRPAVSITKGLTYTGFTRNKRVGSMEIIYSGYVDKTVIRVGNWTVLKTSSNGTISDPLKEGITRFIGQIYKITTSYTTDKSAGHRRRVIKISIREWSHLLFCPVRFDPYAVAGQSFSSVVQTVDSTAALASTPKPWLPNYLNQQQLTNAPLDMKPEQIQKSEIAVTSHESKVDTPRDVIQDINMLFSKYRQPFAYVTGILSLVSNMNGATDSVLSVINQQDVKEVTEAMKDHFKTVSKMPAIPTQLVKDHIYTSSDLTSYDPTSPFSTGFIWYLAGVQKWDQNSQVYDPETGLYKLADYRNRNMADLVYKPTEAFRPGVLIDPSMITSGMSVLEAIGNICESTAYDFYTDIIYVEDGGVIKAAPILVVRDIPFSIREYRRVFPKTTSDRFKWTMYDSLPQLTIRPSSITDINTDTDMLSSSNYFRVVPNTMGIMTGATQSFATFNGTAVIPSVQYRFGGKEMVASTFSSTVMPEAEGSLPQIENDWFRELRDRLVEWHANAHLWMSATIAVKDSDYLYSVGSNIRIPMGVNKPILIGHIDAVDYRIKIDDAGLVQNQVILTISRLGMQDPGDKSDYNGAVVPLPPDASVDLMNVEATDVSGLMLMYQAERPA